MERKEIEKLVCDGVTNWFGDKVTDIKQVKNICFTGEELVDFISMLVDNDLYHAEFVEWYSGMKKEQVDNALKRWRKER